MRSETTITIVQSGFQPRDYVSAEAFAAKVSWCFETTAIREKRGQPRPHLVAFPEHTGTWLSLLTGKSAPTVKTLISRRVLSTPIRALRSITSGRGLSFVFLNAWEAHFHAWIEPFREAARYYDTYVCPGSALLPDLDWRDGRGWQRRGAGIGGRSCLINPQGRILGWSGKIHLSPEERAMGIASAGTAGLLPYQTELGRIGILIGEDGFHERAIERLDRQDCRTVLMPSASARAWRKPVEPGTSTTVEHVWLSRGVGSLIQGRECIALAVNPMSVSWILDRREEGCSHVFINRSNPLRLQTQENFPVEYNGYPGLELIAASHDCEEIFSFTIEE